MAFPKIITQIDLNKEKIEAINRLINNSSPRRDYFLMISLAVIMTTLGIILNNIVVIIGSMLIAPLLYPILSMSLGIVISDFKLFFRSTITILKSATLAISLAIITTFIFFTKTQSINVFKFISTDIYPEYFIIAFISGLAASIALVKANVNESIPGVAISVTLVPPLSILGIGLAKMQMSIINPALTIFLINILGITIASTITFSALKLFKYKKKVQKAVEKDQKIIAAEDI